MATTTNPKPAVTTDPSPGVKTRAIHQPGSPAARLRAMPATRLATVVDRTTKLSHEVLKSVEEGQRAAIEAAGRFLITVEEALPQEVLGTSEVAKKITESGLETADRLVHTQYDFLRKLIDSTGKSLHSSNWAKPDAVS